MDDDPLAVLDRPKHCPQYCNHGWIDVTTRYVDRFAPWPAMPVPPPGVDVLDAEVEAAYQRAVEAVRIKRVALADSVYPCPNCRPEAHHRWVMGHQASDHDRSTCPDCIDVVTPSRARRPRSQPRERKDLE